MKVFYLILSCVFLINPLLGQSLNLSGRILGDGDLPLPGALVQLDNSKRTIRTDSNGYFSFQGLKNEVYKLTILGIGYQSEEREIKLPTEIITIRLYPVVYELQEVTITGYLGGQRKRRESLNVETVNSEFIRRNLGGSLMKSLERLPGIQNIGIGSGQSKPMIRGLGFNRVVVVEKGIKHEGQQWGADHGLEIDQFNATRVELIKGAASVIYGSDAIGGAINIRPAPYPLENTMSGEVDLIGKSNNKLYGSSVNLSGRKKNWFFDSRVTFMNYGDYRVPTERVHVYNYAVDLHKNHLRNTAGRETNFHLSSGIVKEKFESVFYLSNTFSKNGFFANAHGLEPRSVNEELHDASSRDILTPFQQVNHLKLINRSAWNLQDHRMEMELGYQENFRQEFSRYVNHGYMPPVFPKEMGISSNLERKFDKKVYSANLKNNFILDRHSFTVGINSEYQDNKIGGWSFLVPSFQQFTAGVFAYDKYELGESLLLQGALRYDYGKIKITEYTDWFSSDMESSDGTHSRPLTRVEALVRNFHSFIWSAGLNYNPEKFVLKANVGKSFRMPIAKELAANGVNYHYFSYEKGDPSLSPEASYQADMTLGWNEQKWSVQFSPFYNYFPNYIYLNPTSKHDYYYGAGNQVFEYTQSRVMRYGAEMRASYVFFKNFRTELLGEYLYSRQLSGDKKGYTLPFSPPPSVLFNISYEPKFKTFENTYVSIDYKISGKQDHIVPPEKKTPGSSIVNLSAGTKINVGNQILAISLQAQNLFNTPYLNHTSFYRLIELPEVGRNIILSLKVPFSIKSNKTQKQFITQ